jgi:hypothetical protein
MFTIYHLSVSRSVNYIPSMVMLTSIYLSLNSDLPSIGIGLGYRLLIQSWFLIVEDISTSSKNQFIGIRSQITKVQHRVSVFIIGGTDNLLAGWETYPISIIVWVRLYKSIESDSAYYNVLVNESRFIKMIFRVPKLSSASSSISINPWKPVYK